MASTPATSAAAAAVLAVVAAFAEGGRVEGTHFLRLSRELYPHGGQAGRQAARQAMQRGYFLKALLFVGGFSLSVPNGDAFSWFWWFNSQSDDQSHCLCAESSSLCLLGSHYIYMCDDKKIGC